VLLRPNLALGPGDPPEYPWLYAIPGILFGGGYIAAASTGMAGLVQAGYLASSLLCIGSLSGLASQTTARQGNNLGILGVSTGILASLGAVGFPPEVLMQFAGVAGVGSLLGKFYHIIGWGCADHSKVWRSVDEQLQLICRKLLLLYIQLLVWLQF
jgi:hypothetical protein